MPPNPSILKLLISSNCVLHLFGRHLGANINEKGKAVYDSFSSFISRQRSLEEKLIMKVLDLIWGGKLDERFFPLPSPGPMLLCGV